MRDIFIFSAVLCIVIATLRKPQIGVLGWLWLSIMNPHKESWGWVYSMPLLDIIAGVTLISAVINFKQARKAFFHPVAAIMLIFYIWVCLSTIFSVSFELTFPVWLDYTKTMLFVLLMLLFLNSRHWIIAALWTFIFAVGFTGVKGGIFTIFSAVMSHQFLHLPAMWGMMFGLSLLKIYDYTLKIKNGKGFGIFDSIAKIENNTLMFFFGILAAVGALYFIGWLALAAVVYDPSVLGPTWSNIGVGFLSAVIDNIPVMSAVLKASPDMGLDQWMLVTLTAGVGGSMIAFGSAAGVGVMGKLPGIYTFSSHMKYAWTIVIGYFVSIAVWYLQYEVLGFYIKH